MIRPILLTAASVVAVSLVPTRAAGQCEARFQPGFPKCGANGSVYSLAVLDDGDGPALYIGGRFTGVADTSARNIARWDGVRWSRLGDGVPFTVEAMVLHDGQLHAAGYRVDSLTSPEYGYVMRWDGTQWHIVLEEIAEFISILSMASYNGDLYIGGSFDEIAGQAAIGLARWDGTTWSDVGGARGYVQALTVFEDELYASSVSVAGSEIARWNGSTWSPVGNAAHVHGFWHDGGLLYAAGHVFNGPNGSSGVAFWDGTDWTPVGEGLGGGRYAADTVAVYQEDVFAGGLDMTSGDPAMRHIARFDGSSWVPLGAGASFAVWDLAVFDGLLWAGGMFYHIDNVLSTGIIAYDGQQFLTAGSGTNSIVTELHVHDGLLFASGYFFQIADVPAARLAVFDGNQWHDASAGSEATSNAFETHDGQLFATAYSPYRITRWNGSAWEDFAVTFSWVSSLLTWQGNLVAGGDFAEVDGTPAARIARWDGTTWHALSGGIGQIGETARVHALSEFGTQLIAAGRFESADGQPASSIAAWDGQSWSPLGSGVSSSAANATIYALAVLNDQLYAAGSFDTAGGLPVSNIARWGGTAWEDVAGGVDGLVEGLHVHDGQLYVLGRFQNAGGVHSPHIARWDGHSWHAVDGGTDDRVYTAATFRNQLVIGGGFVTAGGQVSASFARLAPSIHLADLDSDGTVDFRDLVQLLAYYPTASGATHPEGDLDGDGDVDFDDLAAFIAAYHATCE